MKTITIRGKQVQVSASEERALRHLANNDYTGAISDFEEGPRRYRKNIILPMIGTVATVEGRKWRSGHQFGIRRVYREDAATKREKAFFAARAKCASVIVGDPRKINAAIKKLEAAPNAAIAG